MSDQKIINLYINELATTKHAEFSALARIEELEGQVNDLTTAKNSVAADNTQLRSEIATLQGQYNALKEQVGSATGSTPPAAPASPEVPASPHF